MGVILYLNTFSRPYGKKLLLPFPTLNILLLPHTIKLLTYAPARTPSRLFTCSHAFLAPRKHKKTSFKPSPEQQGIVKVSRLKNAVVSARPGSGKTATAEAIVAANPDKRVVVLTYSRRLRNETALRLRVYPNCCVYTFHKMAGLLFEDDIWNDGQLWNHRREIMNGKRLPGWKHAPFDIIVLDEFQDCNPFMYWLHSCFIFANEQARAAGGGQHANIVVLGDERQSIYDFQGADSRYLTLAPDLLGPIATPGTATIAPSRWANIPLSQSFRVPDQSAQFINDALLGGEPYITSLKPGPKPIVFRYKPVKDTFALAKQLFYLIKHHGAKNSAIVASYVSSNKALIKLTNTLAETFGLRISVSSNNEVSMHEKVTKHKMCVSTIHQFKGSERDLVIVFDMDCSFFDYFGRHLPDDRCPNLMFVAVTRAANQLVLVHNDTAGLMPFVSVDVVSNAAEVINLNDDQTALEPPRAPGRAVDLEFKLPRLTVASTIGRFLRGDLLAELVTRYLSIQHLSGPLPTEEHIVLPNIVCSGGEGRYYETVSDINGLVLMACYEYDVAGTLHSIGFNKPLIPHKPGDDRVPPSISPQHGTWLARHACEHITGLSGYSPRSIALKDHAFDWISPDQLAQARERLRELVGDSAAGLRFEYQVEEHKFKIGEQTTRLQGQPDIVTVSGKHVRSIWEIKFVSNLSNEHVVKMCVYGYLLAHKRSKKVPRMILYNMRNGEKWEITPQNGRQGLRDMIERLLIIKHTCTPPMKDAEFIENCAKTRREVQNSMSRFDGEKEA